MGKESLLVDADVTAQARALHDMLFRVTGHFAMVGHQDDTLCVHDGQRDSDVLAVTGDYPAVCGFDMGRIELEWDKNIDQIPFAAIRAQMRRAHDSGAIVTLSWHSVNPITEGGYGDNLASGSIEAVLPGGEQHAKYLTWLDRVADFVTSVTDQFGRPIPIIFRPYHEHTGTWFWWCTGASIEKSDNTEEEFIRLWRMTVEYLRDENSVHNLLYAYSPDRSRIDLDSVSGGESDYWYGYPGDAYVDVLGLDDYCDIDQDPDNYSPKACYTNLVASLSMIGRFGLEHHKLAAATEVGSPGRFAAAVGPDANSPWTEYLLGAALANGYTRRVLWYLPWRNSADAAGTGAYGTPDATSPYAADFNQFAHNDFMRLAGSLPAY